MEQLAQQGYLTTDGLKGKRYGDFEVLELGATSVGQLAKAGLDFTPASTIPYPCKFYKAPKRAVSCKPDTVYVERVGGRVVPIAVAEWKDTTKLRDDRDIQIAAEQAVVGALAIGVRLAMTTDGQRFRYIDAAASADAGKIVEIPEARDLTPGVLADLHRGESDVERDPRPLAETVWQIIWHATKAEPKDCLLTFVEIFMLKFLSDNLPLNILPADFRFESLLVESDEFERNKGCTQIEYYVSNIRPRIKQIFAERFVVDDRSVCDLFELATITSHTSVINGFAFLKSSPTTTIASYNRVFRDIIEEFQSYGSLTNIDKEFKLRLYETFLKRSAKEQRLGQFFTPRNIVRPMVKMAQLNSLPEGATVLDPAAGVGGFLLEPLLFSDALPGNITFVDGKPRQRVKLVGLDVDINTNILAKANMLLHLAESVRDPQTTPQALNQALTNTFILMNENETLGSLLYPPMNSVDVILTNPPYVTRGSAIYRDEIEHLSASHRSNLERYYDKGGKGLEALFLRYISGALKPGGRAFVIVPLGMLNRTDSKMKKGLLEECNVIASIQLPRNAFFNTSQPTYILILEKRRVRSQSRPPVFCGIARSVGETLDHERIPTPDDNDLSELADLFVHYSNNPIEAAVGSPIPYKDSAIAKLVPPDEFTPEERWDVIRHWTDEEYVALGERSETVDRADFIEVASTALQEIIEDLNIAKTELEVLESGPTRSVSLSDKSIFQVRSGLRIRRVDIRENPGDIPVYSAFTRADTTKGKISLDWLGEHGAEPEKYPSVTIMATGASAVGMVFVRESGCIMTDDVVIVQPWPDPVEVAQPELGADINQLISTPRDDGLPKHDIDLAYLAVALSRSIAQGGYLYEAKLYTKRVAQLSIEVPITSDGAIDIDRQRKIAAVSKRLDQIRLKLRETAEWSKDVRLS